MSGLSAFGLMFMLGLRHGLDPDHVAVIDNIVFRAVDERPRMAPWTGSLFAIGHSLSVGLVAIGVSLAAGRLALPSWTGSVVDAAVILLLLAVGTMNLTALLWKPDYTPVGWRAGLVPKRLRTSTHPAAVIAIGILFGLVFDTVTQAAAWGAAATAQGGSAAALAIVATFAAGMILVDTLDSQIVGRLLRQSRGYDARIRRYRRAVGWLVVSLSYGMAAYALVEMSGFDVALPGGGFTAVGACAAMTIVCVLAAGRRLSKRSANAPIRRLPGRQD